MYIDYIGFEEVKSLKCHCFRSDVKHSNIKKNNFNAVFAVFYHYLSRQLLFYCSLGNINLPFSNEYRNNEEAGKNTVDIY